MHSLIRSLSLFLTVLHVHAVIVDLEIRTGGHSTSLRRRADSSTYDMTNAGNAQYVANITVGGATLPVLLDTGSSDFWAYFPKTKPTGVTDTGKEVSLSYAVGQAHGHIKTATVQMGPLTMNDQAFLHVEDVTTFSANINSQAYQGLLGLGPNAGSLIRKKMKSGGDAFHQRVFEQDRATDNYISFLLDRKGDPSDLFKGHFSISEIIPGFENVTSMPKLDVDKVNRILKADQHWQALTDEDQGIIGPDGSAVKQKSLVALAPKGQYVAVFDSGFTFSQVPREVSDAIYGRVQGAYYDTRKEWWVVPCGQYINISFNFGGVNYPIHPLDAVDDNFGIQDPLGKRACIGSFQPITSAFSMLGHYDVILGMNFLRNAYTLYNFGNWVKNSDKQDSPYIQMVPLTNPATARSDFVQIRLSGKDTISDPKWALLPADQGQKSPISDEEKKKRYQEMILSKWPYIFVGCLAFVGISVGFCVWKCCQRRRARKARQDAGLPDLEEKSSWNIFKRSKNEETARSAPEDALPTAPPQFQRQEQGRGSFNSSQSQRPYQQADHASVHSYNQQGQAYAPEARDYDYAPQGNTSQVHLLGGQQQGYQQQYAQQGYQQQYQQQYQQPAQPQTAYHAQTYSGQQQQGYAAQGYQGAYAS